MAEYYAYPSFASDPIVFTADKESELLLNFKEARLRSDGNYYFHGKGEDLKTLWEKGGCYAIIEGQPPKPDNVIIELFDSIEPIAIITWKDE